MNEQASEDEFLFNVFGRFIESETYSANNYQMLRSYLLHFFIHIKSTFEALRTALINLQNTNENLRIYFINDVTIILRVVWHC